MKQFKWGIVLLALLLAGIVIPMVSASGNIDYSSIKDVREFRITPPEVLYLITPNQRYGISC